MTATLFAQAVNKQQKQGQIWDAKEKQETGKEAHTGKAYINAKTAGQWGATAMTAQTGTFMEANA